MRVHDKLQELGYGLLVHDAYRPWHVTKMFWDATPPEKRIYVADPDRGSEHNRYTTHDTRTTFQRISPYVLREQWVRCGLDTVLAGHGRRGRDDRRLRRILPTVARQLPRRHLPAKVVPHQQRLLVSPSLRSPSSACAWRADGFASCCGMPWRARASRSTSTSGGTSTTATSCATPSSTFPLRT